jgi:hypothetical protein
MKFLTVASLVARNSNAVAVVGSAFGRSLESGGRFFVGVFGMNLVSVTANVFSHPMYFIKIFYEFCTLNAICKDKAVVNCITYCSAQKSPSTLTVRMLHYNQRGSYDLEGGVCGIFNYSFQKLNCSVSENA